VRKQASLFEQLFAQGLQLITPLRKNMRNRLVPLQDKLLTRKRFIVETIVDQLKNISQIEHTRHRSSIADRPPLSHRQDELTSP